MSSNISVVVPTIPPRAAMCGQAIDSVLRQTLAPDAVITPIDADRQGAAHNRQRGLELVDTEFVAFLDDDDLMDPNHLEKLHRALVENQADYVYSWYRVDGGTDPRAEVFGVPFDPECPVQTTITTLCRTELAQTCGGFVDADDDSELALSSPDRHYAGEDWRYLVRMLEHGARVVHLPEVTWTWRHHGSNTSGLPRW